MSSRGADTRLFMKPPPAASHASTRLARTAWGKTLDAFVAKTKSSTKIPYLWAIDGAAAGR